MGVKWLTTTGVVGREVGHWVGSNSKLRFLGAMFSPKIVLAKHNLENYSIHAIRQNIWNDKPYISRYI